jgi:hypothetical protein
LSRHQRPQPSRQEAGGRPPGSASGQPTRPDMWRMEAEAFRKRDFEKVLRACGVFATGKKTPGGAGKMTPGSRDSSLPVPVKRHRGESVPCPVRP